MLPTQIYSIVIPASGSHRLLVSGQYFKILAASGPVKVQSDFGTLDGIAAGQGLEKTPFDFLFFTDKSGAPNTVQVLVGDENFIDGMTGSVVVTAATIATNVAPKSAAFVNAQKTVTNASAQLLAANAARQYLMIQNKDAAGSIYIGFGATAATVANGVLIGPGGAYELPGAISTQEIQAIGSIASNANIVAVEG